MLRSALILLVLLIMPPGAVAALDDPYGYQDIIDNPVTIRAAIDDAKKTYKQSADKVADGKVLLSLYERAGKWKRGLRLAEKLRRAHPDDPTLFELHNRLLVRRIANVSVFGKLGAASDMRDNCRAMMARDPESSEALLCLIRFNSMARGFADSDADRIPGFLDRLSALDPASYHLAQAELIRQDRPDEAFDHYRQAFAMSGDVAIGVEAVRFFVARQDYDTAFEVAEQLNDRGAGQQAPIFLYQLGRLTALSDRNRDEGIAALLAFLKGPTHYKGRDYRAGAHWRLGQLFQAAGNSDLAELAYRHALTIDEDFKPAEQALEDMHG